jgi:hypothetical protein
VKFGNVEAASFNIVNDTTITAVVGNGATGGVTVASANGSGMGSAEFFYIVVPPVITSVTPAGGTSRFCGYH